MMNMQLAMYQMLSNMASSSTTTTTGSPTTGMLPTPSGLIRSLNDRSSPLPIISHQKSLKRLGQKRTRLVKTNPTSESPILFKIKDSELCVVVWTHFKNIYLHIRIRIRKAEIRSIC